MASPAARLSLLVEANTTSATASLRKFSGNVDKAAANAKRLTSAQQVQAKAMRATGASYGEIAKKMNVADSSIRRLISDGKKQSTAMGSIGKSARTAATHTEKLEKSTHKLGSTMKSAAKYAASAVVAYIGISQAKEAISVTEELAKATKGLVDNLGMSAKEASAWATVAKVRAGDTKKLTLGFKTLSTQIVAAREGSESSLIAFHKLGFTQADLEKSSSNFHFALGKVSEGLHNMKAGTDKLQVSSKLFGKAWESIQPILRGGRKEMNENLRVANEMGATFGGKSLKSMGDLIKATRTMEIAQIGLQIAFTEKVAPALIKAMTAVAKFVKQMRTGKGAGGQFSKFMTEELVPALRKTAEFVRTLIGIVRAIGKVFMGLPGPVKKAIQLVTNPLLSAIDAFARVKEAASGMAQSLSQTWQNIGDIFSSGVRSAIGFIEDLVNAINALPFIPDINLPGGGSGPQHSLGADRGENRKGSKGVHRQHRARGGPIFGGDATGDSIPAMLERGEYVLNRNAVRKLGKKQLDAINFAAAPRFSIGSFIGDKASGAASAVGNVAKGAAGAFNLPSHLGGVFADLAPWLIAHATDWIKGKKKKLGRVSMAPGAMPSGSLNKWLTEALKITGHYSPANLAGLAKQAMSESSGNPHAINLTDINAQEGHPSKGLLQTIDSTFNAYKMKGHGDIWNPVDNAIAAIRYMFARYGHIVSTGEGYAAGGLAKGSAGRAVSWAKQNVGTQEGSKKHGKWVAETEGIADPWCAEFVGAMLLAQGIPLPSNSAYTGSYAAGWAGGKPVGSSLGVAKAGDLLAMGNNEHIGVYVGGGRMVAGNWGNEVAEYGVADDSRGVSTVIRPFYTAATGAAVGKTGGRAAKAIAAVGKGRAAVPKSKVGHRRAVAHGEIGIGPGLTQAEVRAMKAGPAAAEETGETAEDPNTAQIVALLEQSLEIQQEERQRIQQALNVSQAQYGVLAHAITAVVSGQIGGKVGLGFQAPSVAGSLASY